MKLLWHGFLSYSEARHEFISHANNNGDVFDGSPLETKQGQVNDIGHCIIAVLSAIYSLDRELLIPFCKAFQSCCLEIFQQAEHIPDASQNIRQAIKFLVLVQTYTDLKSEFWPLDYLVGPILESSLPLIISKVSSTLVSFYVCEDFFIIKIR